ncbi:MAG: Fe-S-containing hydro-lyase [Spirochaetes bacterium]|jgi:fumarate hydratase subunit beta|nr:Fe-S-containing hydro-lyase [Spirochaetota bacterium]
MNIQLTTPLRQEDLLKLKPGDEVSLSGIIYTARDAAHKRFVAALDSGEKLPVNLEDQVLYYTGPTPARPGQVIGSAGPTTSYRMDPYTPRLLDECGLKGMVGKGDRSEDVALAVARNDAVYFAAIGGAGALIASCVVSCEVVAYDDLGAEAVHKLRVKDFPLIVAIDSNGRQLDDS